MNHFFALMFRMRYIRRWGLMKNSESENLQEHSLEVSMLAHCLAVVRRDVLCIPCDPARAAAAALYHDASEILTGDLPTPVKYRNPVIRDAYKSIEDAARERLLSQLPEELAPAYRELFYSLEEDPALKLLVKAADRLSAYLKCISELNTGNLEFRRAAQQTKAALDKMQMPEIEYFLSHFAPSFTLSLDELE